MSSKKRENGEADQLCVIIFYDEYSYKIVYLIEKNALKYAEGITSKIVLQDIIDSYKGATLICSDLIEKTIKDIKAERVKGNTFFERFKNRIKGRYNLEFIFENEHKTTLEALKSEIIDAFEFRMGYDIAKSIFFKRRHQERWQRRISRVEDSKDFTELISSLVKTI